MTAPAPLLKSSTTTVQANFTSQSRNDQPQPTAQDGRRPIRPRQRHPRPLRQGHPCNWRNTNPVSLPPTGNSGLGEAIIKAYAPHNPATIYLAARRDPATLAPLLERLQALAPRTTITLLQLDLASLASVAAAAARVAADAPRLDILHLNGGISALPRATTTDGYELQFGTNFVGHALLAKLLAPKLLETAALPGADVRVVAVSSVAHRVFAPRAGVEFDSLATDGSALGAMALYGQSMVAKTLYMHELARRYPQVSWTSAHPGRFACCVVAR
ncbi:hypothetical protein FH972_021613 [Carpinus fangiana]|uniref:Ketoreductase (KR) domain-containing protein n=1 Tax=Carpinus fangiana TaxID=176857 RepID=A0A5N6KPS8_9ROSI|nr:hypothetical protein FH972_021613 [Carpinus fangiana]